MVDREFFYYLLRSVRTNPTTADAMPPKMYHIVRSVRCPLKNLLRLFPRECDAVIPTMIRITPPINRIIPRIRVVLIDRIYEGCRGESIEGTSKNGCNGQKIALSSNLRSVLNYVSWSFAPSSSLEGPFRPLLGPSLASGQTTPSAIEQTVPYCRSGLSSRSSLEHARCQLYECRNLSCCW